MSEARGTPDRPPHAAGRRPTSLRFSPTSLPGGGSQLEDSIVLKIAIFTDSGSDRMSSKAREAQQCESSRRLPKAVQVLLKPHELQHNTVKNI